ncbi:hypothetical protein HDU76_009306, partial [Blyttiomyces sp. JEL0837]
METPSVLVALGGLVSAVTFLPIVMVVGLREKCGLDHPFLFAGVWTVTWMVERRLSPFGSWGSWSAYNCDSCTLQLASIGGLPLLDLWMGLWAASVANLWELGMNAYNHLPSQHEHYTPVKILHGEVTEDEEEREERVERVPYRDVISNVTHASEHDPDVASITSNAVLTEESPLLAHVNNAKQPQNQQQPIFPSIQKSFAILVILLGLTAFGCVRLNTPISSTSPADLVDVKLGCVVDPIKPLQPTKNLEEYYLHETRTLCAAGVKIALWPETA